MTANLIQHDNKTTRSGTQPTVAQRWNHFWFAPEAMTTLGLVRIVYGIVIVGWAMSLGPVLTPFFTRHGVQPAAPPIPHRWSLLFLWPGDLAVQVLWVVLLVAALALTVGWHSRIAALVVFVCVMSFQSRNPYILNTGDDLLRLEVLLLALAPCGAALSLDQRRTAGSFWNSQLRAPWALRLMQVQLSIIYLATVWAKLRGETWNNGTAVSYALRFENQHNFAVPDWVTMNPLLMNGATWGTLALELALGILVWNRRIRPWLLAAGVTLHMSILATLAVAFFSFAMFVLYLAFTPADTAQRWVDRVRGHRGRQTDQRHPSTLSPATKAPTSASTNPAAATSETGR